MSDDSAFATLAGKQKLLNHEDGLSKRELFAAMAMQGLVADAFATDPWAMADFAVKHADALLAELAKERK